MCRIPHFLPNTWTSKALTIVALTAICLAASAAHANQATKYIGPSDVVVSKDAKTIYVLCKDAQQVMLLDSAGKATGTIKLPSEPTGFVLSPDGKTLYVTCGVADGRVCLIDTAARKVSDKQIAVGHTPCGPSVSPDSKRLYVCNRFNNDVSVIDLAAAKQI
ncbi:MAG: YncE family protein, partial [Pirellulales bacterium]|nr:YncE family protein [Pirellulales bacterium]